jgi:hypothetical protein
MPELLLHIGRHKSGSTAIQRFLKKNEIFLTDNGFYYPTTGVRGSAHHLISEPMQRGKMARLGSKSATSIPILQGLHSEITSVPGKSIVISSEAFQNCNPSFVREVFCRYDTRVIVYIRNQLEYLASAYAQKVHATDYTSSLDTYFKDIYSVDYRAFLKAWEKQYPQQLTVRKFSRSTLEQGDVVTDFAVHGLGLPDEGSAPPNSSEEANPSLNAKILQLKLYLNREGYYHNESKRLLYHLLPELNGEFESDKVRASQAIRKKLVARCVKSDSAVATRYFGEDQLFEYGNYQTAETTPLPAGELNQMLAAMDERLAKEGITLAMLKRL